MAIPSSFSQTSSNYAYQACRNAMLNTEGYGVWKLKDSKYRVVYATYIFSDGVNDATCSTQGFGAHWQVKAVFQTLGGYRLSLSADNTYTQCPRSKFGVSP